MANWQEELMQALNTGNPDIMRAALEKAPPFAAQMATQIVKSQGHAHYEKKVWQQALDFYDQVVVLDSKDYYVFLRRAECLLRLNRLDEAVANASHCLELSPEKFDSHELLGRIFLERKDHVRALAYFRKASSLKPKNKEIQKRVAFLENEMKRNEENLQKVLNPQQDEGEPQAPPPRPDVSFNPELLFAKSQLDSFKESAMYGGLRHFLNAHSNLQHTGQVLARLEDDAWLETLLQALNGSSGKRLLFWGSEVGILPLAALEAGAEGVVIWENAPFTARLADGLVGKNLLVKWRAEQGGALDRLSDDEKKSSFEAFSKSVTFLEDNPKALEQDKTPARCNQMFFTHFDHSLLGTGFIDAVESASAHLLDANADIFPSKLQVYAMGIEWNYQNGDLDLSGLNEYRWSAYPEKVDLSKQSWRALTDRVLAVEIDPKDFRETTVPVSFPVTNAGQLHGVVFWYKLKLGEAWLCNEPGGALKALGQAFQYVDARTLEPGGDCELDLCLQRGKIGFQTRPVITQPRSKIIPKWHHSMAQDRSWNEIYRQSLQASLAKAQSKTVLCIGAGSGLAPLTAAQTGARVYIGEPSKHLCEALNQNARNNGLQNQITTIQKDIRQIERPTDLKEKADFIVFDLFDCGLLGEGVLHYLQHAREKLAEKDVDVFPRAASLKAMLIERRMESVAGFDTTLLTPYLFSPEYSQIDLNQTHWRALSEPFEVFSFKFSEAVVQEETKTLKPVVSNKGILGAVVFWYELELDENTRLTTSPFENNHFRYQAIQYLPEITVEAGAEVVMDVKQTGSNVIFALNKDHVAKESIVQLPRFDPRWMSMQMQLANQSGQMMQQIHGHPEEYKKVVAMASRMAAQPESVGLDPSIVSRFLESFMLA